MIGLFIKKRKVAFINRRTRVDDEFTQSCDEDGGDDDETKIEDAVRKKGRKAI